MIVVAITLHLLGCALANQFVIYSLASNPKLREAIGARKSRPLILSISIATLVMLWPLFTLLGVIKWLLAKEPVKEDG